MTSEHVSSRSRKVVIAAMIVAAITPIVLFTISFWGDSATTHRYVIALGTRAALNDGKTVPDALPSSLALKVGDSLEITNEDTEAHTYAFLVIRPGETARYTFRQVGTFTGECTVNDHDEVTITVSG